MKIYYKNDLKNSFFIIEEDEVEMDFQSNMLQENHIPGLLQTSVRCVDNKLHYNYNINGKISLQVKHEKEKMTKLQIKKLTDAILQIMQEVQRYMLDGTKILLSPEYIFCEEENYYFCYYPTCNQDAKKEFHKLTEFFVREVDYRDKEGVHLAYTLHKETMEENYSIEKIMERVCFKEEVQETVYEEKIEEQAMRNIAIAEKKELWEPVRKLLERSKREKWGRWEGL